MNGRPLEPQHGFPLRLVVPGWYGMTSVKWLTSIEAVDHAFDGYQQKGTYLFKASADDPGTPVQRMVPKALMIPPGIPDFFSRRRVIDAGPVEVRGRAWSGQSPVTAVEFGVDGKWQPAKLEAPLGEFAWRAWSAHWQAVDGEHELTVRAIDAEGNAQPTDQPWNYQGMANNLVQRVPVSVK